MVKGDISNHYYSVKAKINDETNIDHYRMRSSFSKGFHHIQDLRRRPRPTTRA